MGKKKKAKAAIKKSAALSLNVGEILVFGNAVAHVVTNKHKGGRTPIQLFFAEKEAKPGMEGWINGTMEFLKASGQAVMDNPVPVIVMPVGYAFLKRSKTIASKLPKLRIPGILNIRSA